MSDADRINFFTRDVATGPGWSGFTGPVGPVETGPLF